MDYREEKTFTLELHLSASFPEEYEGDADGYAWMQEFERVLLPRLVRTIYAALRSEPSWRVTPTSRGRNDAVEINVEYTPR